MTCGKTQHTRAEAVFPPAQAALSEPKGTLLFLYLPHFSCDPSWSLAFAAKAEMVSGDCTTGKKGSRKRGRGMRAGGARKLGAGPLEEPAHVYHYHPFL